MPWDPMRGERLAPAWQAALTLLDDNEWHPWQEVLDAMIEASDLLPRTCQGLVYGGIRHEILARQGRYNRRTKKDGRMVRRHP